jgi:hypothetical protein
LSVSVVFCINDPNEHFFGDATVAVNGQQVATGQFQGGYACADVRVANVTVTTPATVDANATTYVGEVADQFYPWSASVSYTSPPPPSVAIDLNPHNGYNRSAALCAVACFNVVASYSIPAYWTLDAPRSVTMMYSSGQVESRHTVQINVTLAGGDNPPTQASMRLRRPDGTYVTLTNGQTEQFFPASTGTQRLAVQFEDSTLATGAYSYTVVARGYWGGSMIETTAPIRILDDQ